MELIDNFIDQRLPWQNYYFNLGDRSISTEYFNDIFFNLINTVGYNIDNVVNMLIGTIYHGNYYSCESIISNFNFSQLNYDDDFVDLLKQTVTQLQSYIDNVDVTDDQAIDTMDLVCETFPYVDNNYDTDSYDNQELQIPFYDSP
jgi:hypothetical protein